MSEITVWTGLAPPQCVDAVLSSGGHPPGASVCWPLFP